MFERYTEKARRVIFFARYEASQFGSPNIETEHLLLGLLREDRALTNRVLRAVTTVESIRREIEKHTIVREKVSTSVDLPVSNECKRVMAFAAEEAERLGHKHIGTEHLLLGLLREEGCFAAQILKERGLELEATRDSLANAAMDKPAWQTGGMGFGLAGRRFAGFFTDLTQKAVEGALEPVVGRDLEVEAAIEVLCRMERRNPMLLGERGAGKTAIVEALAQRIADGKVPGELAEKRVLAISSELVAAWAPNQEKFEDLAKEIGTVTNSANLIIFVDGLHGMVLTPKKNAAQEFAGALKFAMQEAEIRCIGATTGEDYAAACSAYPVLDKIFRPLHVKPLDEAGALAALRARKLRLEKFHEVSFTDAALECAVKRADSYLKEKLLPGKALELLDAAGAAVKLSLGAGPQDVEETMLKLKSIELRIESAIFAHEFEKAKFYQDEERKERENLAAVRKKHGLDDAPALAVGREDVERVIAKWTTYPYTS